MSTHTVTIHGGDWPSLSVPAFDRGGREVNVELETQVALQRRASFCAHHAAVAVLAGHDTVRIADENDRTLDAFPVDVPRIAGRIRTTTDYSVTGPRGSKRFAETMAAAEEVARKASVRHGQRYTATESRWHRVPGVHGEETIVRSVTFKGGKVVQRWTPTPVA